MARFRALLAPGGILLHLQRIDPDSVVTLLLAGFWVGAGRALRRRRPETTVASDGPYGLGATARRVRWLRRWARSTARAPHGAEPRPGRAVASDEHPQFAGVEFRP